jgi:hypothetical protein
MYELIWKVFGVFIFIYSGILNLLFLIIFIIKILFIDRIPWSIIKRKYGKFLIKLNFTSLIGLSIGFSTYVTADLLARVYNSWIHYVIIATLFYIIYKYKLLSFTDD